MSSWLEKTVSACSRTFSRLYGPLTNRDDNNGYEAECSRGDLIGQDEAVVWYRDLEKHSCGEFSYAVIQSNTDMEDHSHVHTRPNSTFVGVYDGHGGPDASRFVSQRLIPHLLKLAQDNGGMSEELIANAFAATENAFAAFVEKAFPFDPLSATTGSCCLVGVIWNERLYIANLGDSRAVIGCEGKSQHCLSKSQKIFAEQLTMDHNARYEDVRQELKSLHPQDAGIVVNRNGTWRVKGIIQVSRSFGDIYLKKPRYDPGPSHPRYHLAEPLQEAVLRSDPAISTRILNPGDKFLIFASDGLWDLLSNQKAVEIVYNNPREGIARKLLKSALEIAARKAHMSYDELKSVKRNKRQYYDDITVVVFYIDYEMLENNDSESVAGLSFRGFVGPVAPAN